jgi:hypothetical protein
MFLIFREKWLFHAAFSPIWRERIIEYNGTIDEDMEQVVFKSLYDEESFYDTYGYEPDEQPLEIQKRCLGINIY